MAAVCIDPCRSSEFLDAEDNKTLLLNKKSVETFTADFNAAHGELKAAGEKIRAAITWFFETFGKDDCKDYGKDVNTDLETDEKSQGVNTKKLTYKSPLGTTAEKAAGKLKTAAKRGVKVDKGSMDTDKTGAKKEEKTRKDKLTKKSDAKKTKRDSKKKEIKAFKEKKVDKTEV